MTHPKTLTVPEAGKIYYDLSPNGSYQAAARGEIPVIRIGRKMRVPVVLMEKRLSADQQEDKDDLPISR